MHKNVIAYVTSKMVENNNLLFNIYTKHIFFVLQTESIVRTIWLSNFRKPKLSSAKLLIAFLKLYSSRPIYINCMLLWHETLPSSFEINSCQHGSAYRVTFRDQKYSPQKAHIRHCTIIVQIAYIQGTVGGLCVKGQSNVKPLVDLFFILLGPILFFYSFFIILTLFLMQYFHR